jgi:hypothetical protein
MTSERSHYPVVLFFSTFVLLAGILGLPVLRTGAQTVPPPGVTIETLSSVRIQVDREKTLQTLRLTFNPGTSLSLAHHPGPMIVTVGSGELTVSVADWDVLLTRDGSTASYAVESGKTYTLDPGDSMTFEFIEATNVLQNEGAGPLVLTATFVSQNTQPGSAFEPAAPAVLRAGRCVSCH